ARVDPEIPAWADSIVLKAMAKDPGDRYQSAGEMRNDIQRALQGMPVAAPMRAENYQGTRRMGSATQMAGPTSAIPPYRYGSEDEDEEEPQGRKKWPWIAAAIAVPNVVGQSASSATSALQAKGFQVSEKPAPNSTAPQNQVVRQDPAA